MKISSPAGHDPRSIQTAQRHGPASHSTTFAQMLTDRPTAERASRRAFGFGEFGILGLHSLRDPKPATAARPDGVKGEALQHPALVARSSSSASTRFTGSTTVDVADTDPSPPSAGKIMPPESDAPIRHVAILPASARLRVLTAISEAIPELSIDGIGRGADAQRHSRTTPWFSISLDETANSVQLSAALHDLDEPDRERLLRRLRDVAAEFGVELTEFRLDGQPVPSLRIKQRS